MHAEDQVIFLAADRQPLRACVRSRRYERGLGGAQAGRSAPLPQTHIPQCIDDTCSLQNALIAGAVRLAKLPDCHNAIQSPCGAKRNACVCRPLSSDGQALA